MAVTYNAGLRSARMREVIDAIDAETDPGTLQIGTAGMAQVLVELELEKPSFTESGGVITMAGVPISGVAGASGTAAAARIRDGDDNDVVTGLTVGTSGAEVNLNSVDISSGQTVTLSSGTITHS